MIKRFLAVSFILTTSTFLAQRNSSSPYSFFGIGQDFRPRTIENASMGGIGVAMTENNYLNFSNPAANANIRFATYALGGKTSFLTLKENNNSQSGSTYSLRYIALAFPIGNKAGFSAGLQPLSSVGYALLNNVTDNNNEVISKTRYTGNGGTNKLYGSFGINIYKGLNLGIEASYVFGTIKNDILNIKKGVSLGTKHEESLVIRGSQVRLGLQYKLNLKNDNYFNVGSAVELANDLNITKTERLFSVLFSNTGTQVPKNLSFNKSSKGISEQPLKTTFGAGFGKNNKWYTGINYEFQGAPNKNNFLLDTNNKDYKYENSSVLSLGGYYIPKMNSITSYWNRITYRAGLRFENTGLLINGSPNTSNNFTSINDFGINIGLGLPLPKQMSTLNLGFEYGQKGTTNNNLIKENYFNVRLSLSLNDLFWFKKRRID